MCGLCHVLPPGQRLRRGGRERNVVEGAERSAAAAQRGCGRLRRPVAQAIERLAQRLCMRDHPSLPTGGNCVRIKMCGVLTREHGGFPLVSTATPDPSLALH
eukprot:scaffold88708_cov51-Phaeocystis_antarctica.AAC.2